MVELARSPVQRLERAAHVAGSRGDPFRELIEAQCEVAAAILERQAAEPFSREDRLKLARDAIRELGNSLRPIVKPLAWKQLLQVGGLLALGGLACGVGGFLLGRWSVDRQLLAIQDAAFVAQIFEGNSPGFIREYCLNHRVPQEGGGTACALPTVWYKPPPPTPAEKASLASDKRRDPR